jgi:predicted phage terminase large subunit-like protein
MIDHAKIEAQSFLTGSLLAFCQTFFPLTTGREFKLSQPTSRESHFVIIARALLQVFRGEITNLMINVPPRYGKTELLVHFVAMAMARYPDSNFIYTCYSKDLAETATRAIREIMTSAYYTNTFDVRLADDSTSKSDFRTQAGGRVYAAGTGGTITGIGAGVRGVTDRFSGALIIDDLHKPEEVFSDTIRESDTFWYYNTARSRRNNGELTPIIYIGQRLHEDDAATTILSREPDWTLIKLSAIDAAGNALYPEMHTKEDLVKMRELEPYVFAAQMQQDPVPAGGGLFKADDFKILDNEPEILATVITADTAETDKSWNDETVFSFFGLYKANSLLTPTDLYCLHWLDCWHGHIEPKDLQPTLIDFYMRCMKHQVKPQKVAVEKKSTGVTLISVLRDMQGINIYPIERTIQSGNKSSRFVSMQRYIANKQVTFPKYGAHNSDCINHMCKITANNSHAHDDIADTLYDAIKISLIDKVLIYQAKHVSDGDASKQLAFHTRNVMQQRQRLYTNQFGG